MLGSFRDGFLNFYDTTLPFRRSDFPLMHADVLLAIFGFALAAGILIAARRPIGAAVVLVVGIGWPTTLVPGSRPLLVGALALVGVLAVLFLLRSGTHPARGLAQGFAVALVLVVVAAVASTSGSVAKGAFLTWQGWDPYDQPDDPVGVRYVWNSHYLGIHFPKKKTTVLKVKTEGAKRNLYWRATTLDDYTGTGWQESLDLATESDSNQIDSDSLALLPAAARNQANWVKQDVTVEALKDNHLVASAQPMRWDPPSDATFQDQGGDIVVLSRSLQRDQTYTVWSYAPQPTPKELGRTGTNYPESIERYLEVIQTAAVPKFGTPDRDLLMNVFFDARLRWRPTHAAEPRALRRRQEGRRRAPLIRTRRQATLEAWFRQPSLGGFVYDEQPPVPPPTSRRSSSSSRRRSAATASTSPARWRSCSATSASRLAWPPGSRAGATTPIRTSGPSTGHGARLGRGLLPAAGAGSHSTRPPAAGRSTRATPRRVPSSPVRGSSTTSPPRAGGAPQSTRSSRRRPGQARSRRVSATRAAEASSSNTVRDKGPSIVVLAFLVLAAAALVVIGLKTVRRTLRFAGRDPRELAGACRRDLMAYLADQGMEVPPSATLGELGELVERYFAVDAGPFVRAATIARFGPPDQARVELVRARRELRRVRSDIRNRINMTSRVRGALSLRSLAV